ncbi:hypothetical protein [Geoalkalibacter sp.]|uniref:hypothetical protein n=1 Tax=Geoalkalibacter sp. TaxID=3041440 RepID=UPI00272DF3DA|nr:hypothetical protein [Geoalkalibacter sp.]
MNIVPPVTQPNLVVHALSQPAQLTREERRQDLLLHQMIRATVEEGGQEKALLQFGERKLWVESRVPLRAGERLNLQVIETHPELKLRILDSGLLERLGRSLHLLGNRLDVARLAAALGSASAGKPEAVLAQLADHLGRDGAKPLPSGALSSLAAQLGLALERQLLSGQAPQAQGSLKSTLLELQGQLLRQQGELKAHLQPLFAELARLPRLLATGAGASAAALGEGGGQVVDALLTLARLQPAAAGQAEATAALKVLEQGLAKVLAPFAEDTAEALARVRQVLAELPALLLNPAAEATLVRQFDAGQGELLATLLRLMRREPQRLLGTEGEALAGKLAALLEKEALGGLSRALDKSGDALQHLELWQMCRARLGEIGVDFLPLPLSFLEQGYLVARRQGEASDQGAQSARAAHSLTLFLELEGLGPLQIDCLYQDAGLYLRFFCRDREVAGFLAGGREELAQALGEDTLRGAAFAAGAEEPAQALIRRLIPPTASIVNARV